MNIIRKGIRKLIHILGGKKLIPPQTTLRLLHTIELGRFPNLKSPKDLNEKLIWMEINSDTTQWSNLSDKAQVREFVKSKGFENNLVPLIGVYESCEEIDFNSLPSRFVMKSTNGSEQILIVEDKNLINKTVLSENIKKWMKNPFGLATGESHYLKIKPRIIIEEYIGEEIGILPTDYKFYCFNGEVDSCLVITDRNQDQHTYKLNLIDIETWQDIPGAILPIYHGDIDKIKKPDRLAEMIKIAQVLSKDFLFVRVDLYNVNHRVFFGEMTFTPSGCRNPCMSKDQLIYFGEKIKGPLS